MQRGSFKNSIQVKDPESKFYFLNKKGEKCKIIGVKSTPYVFYVKNMITNKIIEVNGDKVRKFMGW